MRRSLGTTCITCVLAIAGFAAVSVGGYMAVTGNSLCSLIACGDSKAKAGDARAVQVANKEKSEKKSGACCALKAAAAKSGEKSCDEAKVVAASNTEKAACSAAKAECAEKIAKGECTDAKAECAEKIAKGECTDAAKVVAASNTEKKSGCCKSKAEGKAVAASNTEKAGCSAAKAECAEKIAKGECIDAAKVVAASNTEKAGCSAAKAECAEKLAKGQCTNKSLKAGFVMMNASFPVVMPAAFFDGNAKMCPASLKEAGCGEAAQKSCSGAKTVAASNTEKSGCCKAKAEGKAVAASNTEKACDPGCCKGTGVRADGQPCKSGGDHCKGAAEKAAETKAGEPVASR
jgi:hypothetical protein